MRHAIRRSAIALGVFGIIVAALVLLVLQRPGGFIPEDDQGYMLMVAQLPAGASLQRTEQVLEKIRACYMVRRDGTAWKIMTISEIKPPYLGPGNVPR